MPFSDPHGYEDGHFRRVYEDIFVPACNRSGFTPVRGDDLRQTNFIHLDILQRLIDSQMAICDLSSANPNVLFELGLRQAFDKPTVLVQEVGTQKIFDIAPLRYTEYRKELRYREVLEDQEALAKSILATKDAAISKDGINSIVRILSLSSPATIREPNNSDSSALLQIIRAEINELRSDFQKSNQKLTPSNFKIITTKQSNSDQIKEISEAATYLERNIDNIPPSHFLRELNRVTRATQNLSETISDEEYDTIKPLQSKIRNLNEIIFKNKSS